MSAKEPVIVGFVEGSLKPELLEGGVGFFDFGEDVVHTRVLTWNALHAILTAGNKADEVCATLAEQRSIPVASLQRLVKESIQMHVLMNSPGGKVRVASALKEAMNAVRNGKGRTIAYGTEYICSAAADVFGHAERRYALRDTTFLFHGRSIDGIGAGLEHTVYKDTPSPLRRARLKEMESHKRMLLSHVKGEQRRRVRWTFDIAMRNPENRLLDAFFRGEDLRGFVRSAFVQRRDLWNAFVRETGVHPDFARDLFGSIRPFFMRVRQQQDS